MKHFLSLSIFLFFSITKSGAQQATLEDIYTYGGSGNQFVNDMAIDTDGNVLMAGFYESGNPNDFNPGADLDSLPADISYNGFITKWSPDGIFQWAVPLISPSFTQEVCEAVATDSQGNVIVTGYFGGTVDFDPGPDEFLITANSSAAVLFVLKLTGAGEFLWAFSVDAGIFYPTNGQSIAVDSEDNIILGGIASYVADFNPGDEVNQFGSVGLMDCVIAKYNPDGEFIWFRAFGSGATDQLFDLAVDTADNIYCTGYLGDSADVDPGAGEDIHTILGSVDAFIHKLNPDGEFVWFIPVAGIGNDQGFGIDCGNDGTVAVTGVFTDTIDLDSTAAEVLIESTGGGWFGTFIIRYDTSGTLLWGYSINDSFNNTGNAVLIDDYGNTLVTGSYLSVTDFDSGPGITSYTSNADGDAYMLKLDNQGHFLSAAGWGGSGQDQGTAIVVDSNNLALVAGNFAGECDFDPTPLVTSIGSDSYDCFLTRLNTCFDQETQLYETACESFSYNEVTYTESGVYIHTFLTSVGCDSIVTLNLTIPVSEVTLTETACDSYQLNNEFYTESGTYTQTLQSSAGCDSVIVLNLTIPVISNDVVVTGNTISAVQQDADYQWIDCNSKGQEIFGADESTFTPTEDGSYAVEISLDGCLVISDCADIVIDDIFSIRSKDVFSIYPNPNQGAFRISGQFGNNARLTLNSIADGRLILSIAVTPGQHIIIPEISSGIYELTVSDSQSLSHQRLIIEK